MFKAFIGKSISGRAFISLAVFLSFVTLAITSVLMFINQHSRSVAMLHTLVGFCLVLIVLWHLRNNFKPFKQYLRPSTGRGESATTNSALPLALIFCGSIIGLSLLGFAPFLAFYDWGNQLRANDRGQQALQLTYLRAEQIPADAQGIPITIDLRKGPYFMWPQYAIWIETLDGDLIQPLYITQKLARGDFSTKVTKRDAAQVFTENPFLHGDGDDIFTYEDDPTTSDQRLRPESLPVFLHKLAQQSTNNTAIDAYTGATLTDNFLLTSQSRNPLPERFRVRLEINQSFDFNDYYSSNRFPDDPVYSGNGYSAQPSLVFEAVIDLDSGQTYYPMNVIGRGHHSGANGTLLPDLDNLTTALELIDRVIVEVKKFERSDYAKKTARRDH